MNTTTTRQATPKQLAFLKTLFAERTTNECAMDLRRAMLVAYHAGTFSTSAASAAIDLLLKNPAYAKPAAAPAARGASLPDVPAGHYAVASATGNNDLDFYRVDRPTEGRFAGRTYVKRVIGGHADQNISFGEVRTALERIAADPDAGPRYGREIGRCCRCNRHLTDDASRARGIGPDCATK